MNGVRNLNFSDLPEINFVTADPQEIISANKKIVESILGRTLERADPLMIYLNSLLAIIIQQRILIDYVAKQNLLAYATGENLRHLGILVGVERLPAESAVTTAEVRLSAPRQNISVIRAGTRFHAGDNVYFALDGDVIFLAGETVHTVKATCTQTGEVGNGYGVGELNRIVDPQPFLLSIVNLTESEGGADVETDDSYRERIRLAPESFSNAGSEGAYIFFTKQVSSLIQDVMITSENPGEVDIYPLLSGGNLPGEELLQQIYENLSDKKVRPLTDNVFVKCPSVETYEINLRYCIAESDADNVLSISAKVDQAVKDFITWQRSALGRDINDTELYYRVRAAGAKRAEIIYPRFTVIPDSSIAVCSAKIIQYAGIERD